MTIKQKFNLIDQTKLDNSQKTILVQIKEKTNNFTTKDKEVITKIDSALDKIISSLKEKMPDAIKTVKAKKSTTSTAAPQTVKKTKRTAMGLAKEIRKPGESWKESLERARKQMKEDSESATKIMKSEIQKLKDFIKNHKELKGISNTDLLRDAVRKAKPKGRRVSKDGNVYYEYRDNRTDRLAPNYPSGAPKLENGGDFMSGAYANDGMMLGNSNGIEENIDLSDDNKMRVKKMDYKYKRKSAREIAEKHNPAAFEYMNNDSNKTKAYAVGGGIFADTFTGETGTHYTGLVGETNAMSSGEMFENGGEFSDNQRMIMNQNVQLEHHHEELENILQDKTPVPAWVVAKMATASDNISDITHYLEGEKKYGNSNKKQTMNKKSIYEDGGNLDYWEDYQNDSPKLTKANLSSVEDEVDERIEEWNENNELGQENEVSARGAKKVLQLAENFFKAKGYISADIIDAMISQESYMDGGFMNGVYAESGAMIQNQQLINDATMNTAKMFANEGIPAYVPVYRRGGMLTPSQRYVQEIKGLTGLTQNAIENYISENKLTNHEVLNIVIGLGRKQIERTDVSTAMIGKKGNAESKKLLAFAKSNKALSYAVGGGIFSDAFTGYTGTHYTGLVGETNAMSSGEMFAKGGGVGLKGNQKRIDMNHNGKLDSEDFRILRNSKKRYSNGGMMDNISVHDGTSFMNTPVYKRGGAIKNQYAGRTPEDIWDNLTIEQKRHFLFDHENEFPERFRGYYVINELAKRDFENSPKEIKLHFKGHIETGQYANGGFMNGVYKDGGEIDKLRYEVQDLEEEIKYVKLDKSFSKSEKDKYISELKKDIAYKKQRIKTYYQDNKEYANGGFMDGIYKRGGKVTFEEKSNAIAKQFEGKQVEPKYQRMYGKKYSRGEAKEVGNKIAGKMKAMYDEKAFGGLFGKSKPVSTPTINLDEKQVRLNTGEYVQVIDQTGDSLLVMDLGKIGTGAEPKRVKISDVDMNSFMAGGKVKKRTTTTKTNSTDKRGGAMQLAKKIRKEGEKWQDALKRARLQLKK
jgi:hypothetical protein